MTHNLKVQRTRLEELANFIEPEKPFSLNAAIEELLKPDEIAQCLRYYLVNSEAVLNAAFLEPKDLQSRDIQSRDAPSRNTLLRDTHTVKKQGNNIDKDSLAQSPGFLQGSLKYPGISLIEKGQGTAEIQFRISNLIELLRSSQLQTLESLKLMKKSAKFSHMNVPLDFLDMDTAAPVVHGSAKQGGKLSENSLIDTRNECILRLSVYPCGRSFQKWMEFKALGSNLLTELRDKIRCESDTLYETVRNVVPHLATDPNENDRSACFFLDGKFYDDTREPNMIPLSTPIRTWILRRKNPKSKYNTRETRLFPLEPVQPRDFDSMPSRGLDLLHPRDFSNCTFDSLSMEGVRLQDLHLALSVPYLYLHFGDCEHYLVIHELRSFHKELDSPNRQDYPMILYQYHHRRRKCRICEVFTATWITLNDLEAPENPCFFCHDCYRMLHCDSEGNTIHSDHILFQYLLE